MPAPTDEPSAATRMALRAKSVASRVWTVPVAYGLMTLVVVTTMLWGWGFLAIYRRPLTRIMLPSGSMPTSPRAASSGTSIGTTRSRSPSTAI